MAGLVTDLRISERVLAHDLSLVGVEKLTRSVFKKRLLTDSAPGVWGRPRRGSSSF